MIDRFFVDTLVLAYALDPNEAAKRRIASSWIAAGARAGTLTLSPQSLTEAYRALVHKPRGPRLPANDVKAFLRDLIPDCTAPLDAGTVTLAWTIEAETGFGWFDSVLLSSAVLAGCRLFLTEDMQPGREIMGMRLVDPFGPGAPEPSLN